MDTALFAEIQRSLPKFNRRITRGFATEELKGVEDYIQRLIRCAELRFPPGLTYMRCERCTPTEEYNFATAKKTTKQYYEYSQTDVYLMKYYFEYKGVPLRPRYLYLPFVDDGGIIRIMGNRFSISPVLADIAVSAGDDNVFIPLNLDKLTFRRVLHHYVVDGKRVGVSVVHSEVYHRSKKSRVGQKRTINALSTLAHYQFAKWGLQQTFARYLNTEIMVGNPEYINHINFPIDEWVVCESTQVKPYGNKNKFYVGTDIRIAIRREHYSASASGLIAGFFYIADRFPEQMNPEYVNNERFWRELLGHVIFASEESVGKLLNKVDGHIESLDGYIDAMSQEWLKEDNVFVNDLYELFQHVIDTYSERTANAAATSSTMYGKRLMVLRYVMIDVIKAIFNMMFGLQTAAKKGLTENDINKIMDTHFKPHIIHRINHRHGEVSSVSNPSPCMSFKVTSNIVLQTNITSGASAAKTNTITSANILHSSIAEIGQFNNLPKGEPTGRKRFNPYGEIDERNITVQRERTAALLNRVQADIER